MLKFNQSCSNLFDIMEYKIKEILKLIEEKDHLKITDICKITYLSRSTVRRALIILEQKGLVKRYYGGVSLISKTVSEKPYNLRANENIKLKEKICAKAVSFIHDSSVIFIDSSSTSYYLLNHIKRLNNITILTNSIEIALYFKDYASIKVYIAPGYLKTNSVSIIGQFTVEFLSNFKVDIAFFSCKSFDYLGCFEGDEMQAYVKKQISKNALCNIVLCDSSKYNKNAYFRLFKYEEIDYLISDLEISDDFSLTLKTHNCNFIKV